MSRPSSEARAKVVVRVGRCCEREGLCVLAAGGGRGSVGTGPKAAAPRAPDEVVAWNSAQGWIACGGESGLLKARPQHPALRASVPFALEAVTCGVAAWVAADGARIPRYWPELVNFHWILKRGTKRQVCLVRRRIAIPSVALLSLLGI